jgi:hypothetical protein
MLSTPGTAALEVSTPAVSCVCLADRAQGLPGSLPWGMMLTFFTDYLSVNKGFSVQVCGGTAGMCRGSAGVQDRRDAERFMKQQVPLNHSWAMRHAGCGMRHASCEH